MQETATLAQARSAQETVKKQLHNVEGVRAIGITWDERHDGVVLVYVATGKRDEIMQLLGDHVGPVAIQVAEISEIVAE